MHLVLIFYHGVLNFFFVVKIDALIRDNACLKILLVSIE